MTERHRHITVFPGRLGRLAAGVALAAVLGACSLTPRYERPAAPVPTDWPGGLRQAAQQGAPTEAAQASGQVASTPAAEPPPAPADVPWQDFFGDERLKRLLELGLANNRDLRVAVGNIEQARAAYQIQRAGLFPGVNANASATRSRTPQDLSLTGRPTVANVLGLNVGVASYEIDFFGRVRALRDQALSQFLALDETRKSVQITLVSSIASAYLSTVADDELLKLTQETLATREESYRLSKLKFDAGAASDLDLQQADTLVQGARAALAQLKRQRQQDENLLVLLIGQPLPTDLPPGQGLVGQTMLAEVPAGLPSDLLFRRPDIRAAENQLIGANANIGAARANFFPRISLTGAYGFGSRDLGDLVQSNNGQWSFGPSISLPIFDGGRNRAGLESARAGREIAVAQYEKSIQTAFREVSDALAGAATYDEQLSALKAQAEAEGKRFTLSDMRYRAGASSYLDLLDAQRSLFQVQQTVIQTQLAQLLNKVALYRSLGGGWTEDDTVAQAAAPRAPVTR